MIGRLNHVAIATLSIERSAAFYRDVLGARCIHETLTLPEQGVSACFVDLANTQLELIEPYGDASPLIGFLSRKPAGAQHHVCYEVDDIEAAVAEMRSKRITVLSEGRPRIGAHGTPVVFLHPKDMHGVLTELMERPRVRKDRR